ncbi:GGDEF domain-containing protein, partial [Escherichia coli]|nr:GGDEF domain-containing protein [Escherichia coli]
VAAEASRLRAEAARLELEARLDGLTGVGNRSYAEAVLRHETMLAAARREPFAVILYDLDGLKAVNDRHGHLAGDRALQQFVAVAGDC